MKPFDLKKLSVRLSICMVLITAAFIIHSCKKDSKFIQLSAADSVNQAKTWYESTYPVNTALNSKLIAESVHNPSGNGVDYSQFIKPDWKHTANYKRFNKAVIEMPVDGATAMQFALKNNTNGQLVYSKENSKTSFILLNDGKGYTAYMMTIIADPTYLGNDPTKIARNTYRKRDADFTGMVFYFTPKGQFVRSYAYKQGKLVVPAAPAIATQAVNSTKKVAMVAVCIDWYWTTWVNGEVISEVFLYESCTDISDGGGGGGGSPPPTCNTPGTNSVSHLTVNVAQPPPGDPGDGGFPDPGSPCTKTTDPTDPNDPNVINFGLDANCLNCRIADYEFDEFLDYVRNLGLTVRDPFNTILTVNGVQYPGQITAIYDNAVPPNLIRSIFSPDVTSGPFVTGIEYNVGNTGPAGTATPVTNPVVQFGDPVIYVSSSNTITYTPPQGGGGGGGGGGSPSSNIFSDLNNPIDAPDDPVTDLGVSVTDVSADDPLQGGRIIATTADRRPLPPKIPEDMTYGTNGNSTGINQGETNLSDDDLFNGMSTLFYECTVFDQSGLGVVGNSMIQKFRAKTGGQYSDPILNGRVAASAEYKSFIQKVATDLNDKLRTANGDVNQVSALSLGYHPIFNGLHNKFHGLQILINDTEYTEIQIADYFYYGNGVWSATFDITIHDDFGLDKNDAFTYQGVNRGFADWWLLQHTRGYRPFETIVHLRQHINFHF